MYSTGIMDCLISRSDFKHWINPLICLTNCVQTAEELQDKIIHMFE